MRRHFIAGNWKMNLDRRAARSVAAELRDAVSGATDRDIALFPTFVSVTELADLLDGTNVGVGAQDISHEAEGAFTGEISGSILRSTGATMVILGHSERRHVMGESDEVVGQKMRAALSVGLRPILCCGETIDERESGATNAVVERQLRAGLSGVAREKMADVTIAYEPVWAIGTGKTATPDMAQEVHGTIRALVTDLYDRAVAEDMRIQYGGSVKPGNVDELMSMPDIDGALVGGASLDAASFARICLFKTNS